MTIIEELKSRRAKQASDSALSFRRLLSAVCDGEIDAESAEEQLAELGKSLHELESGVAALRRRRELARLVDRGPEAERERLAKLREIEAVQAEMRDAVDQYQRRIFSLQADHQALLDEVQQAHAARAELVRTAGRFDSSAVESLKVRAEFQTAEHHRRRMTAKAEIDRVRDRIRRLENIVSELRVKGESAATEAAELAKAKDDERAAQRHYESLCATAAGDAVAELESIRLDPESV